MKKEKINFQEITTLERPFGISYFYKPHQQQKFRTFKYFAAAKNTLELLEKNPKLYGNIQNSFNELLENDY